MPACATHAYAWPDMLVLCTGHSGAWLLYQVSQHPEVEAKICAELDQHGLLVTPSRPNSRKVTYEDLGKLTYLDMVIKVSLSPKHV